MAAAFDFTGGRHGDDEYGHGTHVAGIIAGDGGGQYAGLAPGSHVVSLRVLGPDGSGDTSDVIRAIDWAIESAKEPERRADLRAEIGATAIVVCGGVAATLGLMSRKARQIPAIQ